MTRAPITQYLGSQMGGGTPLAPFWWEESSNLQASNNGGRQWSLGNANKGGTVYIPVGMEVAYVALEIRYSSPDGSTDIVQGSVTVQLETVNGIDTTDDSDVSPIDGATVSFNAIANGTGKRRGTAVVEPDGVVITGGSWIRPVTTAPTNSRAGDTPNRSVFTVWLRQK